jgi:hypothetical protein
LVLVLISFGISVASNNIFTEKHYAGICCLLISSILYFTNRKIYYLFFLLTLIIGLTGLLDFYITSYKVGFAGVGVNPIFIGLMILFFTVSKDELDKLAPEKKQKKRTLSASLINSYEPKFKDKSITELNIIANENSKFTDEAKEAAKLILKKKNVL